MLAGNQLRRPDYGRPEITNTILGLIGHTPMVQLPLKASLSRIYLKLESFNVGGSVKDRAALNMIIEAERRGDLRPGGTILESSSGNTGVALAQIGAARGYRVVIVVDNHVQREKVALMRSFGAKIEHVGQNLPPEQQAAEERELRIKQLLSETPNAFYANQGDNLDNAAVHYRTTAEEIVSSVGRVDYLFASIGTGGTISGTGRRLKEIDKRTRVVGIEPKGSVFFGAPYEPFLLTGAGSTREIWKNIDFGVIDAHYSVTDRQATTTCRFLARRLGLSMGGTGGMVVHTILDFIAKHEAAASIVGIVPDGGAQYLTSIYDDDYVRAHNLVDHDLDKRLGDVIAQD